MVKKSGDQTGVSYSGGVTMTWDAEVYDTNSWHDTVTNNTRLTVPTPTTKVIVEASVRIQNLSPTGAFNTELAVMKNGSVSFDGACATSPYPAGNSTTSELALCSGPIDCTSGDFFELKLTVAVDVSIDIIASRTHFSIRGVG